MSELNIAQQNMVVSPVKIKFPPSNPTYSSVRYLQTEVIALRSELKKQKQLNEVRTLSKWNKNIWKSEKHVTRGQKLLE